MLHSIRDADVEWQDPLATANGSALAAAIQRTEPLAVASGCYTHELRQPLNTLKPIPVASGWRTIQSRDIKFVEYEAVKG
ncbi:MAG: hypothetical protein ACREBC_01745 [Pyrinomonadaceae bacterium]